MKHRYTFEQLADELSVLRNTFDVVRLVNPVGCRTCRLCREENGSGPFRLTEEENCYGVWKSDVQCSNCISARSVREKSCCVKFEPLDDRIYTVISKYIDLQGTGLALELAIDVTENAVGSFITSSSLLEDVKNYNANIITDPLTRAYNRQFMTEHLTGILSNAHEVPPVLHLSVIGIDHFRRLNEMYGKLAGDAVLCAVASHLSLAFAGMKDTRIARYGGDEFLILAQDMPYVSFIDKIQNIIDHSNQIPILCNDRIINFTFSAGCATFDPSGCKSAQQLIGQAYRNLEQSKMNGRSRLTC